MTERHRDEGFSRGVALAQADAVWSTPEVRDLGHLRRFVQTGGGKTGPCCEGKGTGSGEECKKDSPQGSGNCGGNPACGQPPCVP